MLKSKRQKKIKFDKLPKITGISTPLFGISWEPPESKRTKIHGLIRFLEDKRVLYNPYRMEVPIWASESIIQIRNEITTILKNFDKKDETAEILSTMRSACRKYLDSTYHIQNKKQQWFGIESYLSDLRSVFGLCIGKLAIMYGIDIEEQLKDIIPVVEDDGRRIDFDKEKGKIIIS